MASTWAKGLPRVTVGRALAPKPITFIYPYYENPLFLADQISGWWQYPEDLRWCFHAVVVDDGSPQPARIAQPVPFPIRLFRIGVDVRWNWLAARNIGAHHAADGWILLTDMDHLVPVETARALVWGRHDPKVVYAFSRREHTGAAISPHSASFLMTREMFWATGGYDETLSGHYGTDGEFRRRLAKVAPIHILPDELIRYEYVADSSTRRFTRKEPHDAVVVKQLVSARGKEWTPKVLSFPYEEVSC